MYERFTDRARKVMALADQEARHFKHDHIGAEHVLLGLLREGSGVGANVLKNLKIDLRALRVEVSRRVDAGTPRVVNGKLPLAPHAQRVIEYAIAEARSMGHNYVGTEHLLLGMLDEPDGVAAQALIQSGANPAEVRAQVHDLLGAHYAKTDAEGDAMRPTAPQWALSEAKWTAAPVAVLTGWIKAHETEQSQRAAGGEPAKASDSAELIAKARELLDLLESKGGSGT